MSAITQDFTFESDVLKEFLKVIKAMLPILFNAGCNEDPQFHNMFCDLGESPRYWLHEDDSKKDGPQRKCVIAISHHLSGKANSPNEVKLPMKWAKPLFNKCMAGRLEWHKESYKLLHKAIKKAIKANSVKSTGMWAGKTVKGLDVNGWIKSESNIDGSHGMNYKARFKESSLGCLYISLGY